MPSYQQNAGLSSWRSRRRAVFFGAFAAAVLAVIATGPATEQEVGNHTVTTHDVGLPLFGTLAGG